MDGSYTGTPLQAKADFAAELAFFEALGGPVAFTTIPVTGGNLRSCVLDPRAPGSVETLLCNARKASQGVKHRNLYFTLNETRPQSEWAGNARNDRPPQKPSKQDVVRIRGVAIDLDPDAAAEAQPGGLQRERERLLQKARDLCERETLPPSAVVDSGNGVQAIWLFPEPLPHTPENEARCEALGRALAKRHGGDAVQSVEHLFRVPGTANFPDKKKITKGRKRTESKLLHFDPSQRAPLFQIESATPELSEAKEAEHACGAELDYLAVLDAAEGGQDGLEGEIAEWRDQILRRPAMAQILENNDRSERDFAIACQCINTGISDPTTIAAITFSLSPDKLLEKGLAGAGQDYAERTIGSALKRTEMSPHDFFEPIEMQSELGAPTKRRNGLSLRRVGEISIRPPVFLVRDLVETDGLALLFGDPAAGKSFVALDLAASVATGRAFHGQPVKAGPVIYIAGEGHNGIGRRLAAWEAHTGEKLNSAPLFISTAGASLLSHESFADVMSDLAEAAVEAGTPALIVIDTLARNFGPGDENSTPDMNKFVAAVDRLRAPYPGSVVLIVHHTGHGDKSRARGSIVLRAALDAEYRVEKVGDSVVFTNTKMKDAPPPASVAFKLNSITVTRDGQTFESAVLEKTAVPVKATKLTDSANIGFKAFAAVRDKMEGNESDQTRVGLEAWRDEFFNLYSGKSLEAKRKAFDRARAALVDAGLLSVDGDNYSLGAISWPAA